MKSIFRNSSAQGSTTPNAEGSAKDHYYAAAATWDMDVIRHAQVSRNRAYLFSGISWLVTVVMSCALVFMVMREKIEVVTIAYNTEAGTLKHVRYNVADAQRITGREAIRKYHVNQWVVALETWSAADARQRAKLLSLYVSPKIEGRIAKAIEGTPDDRALGSRLERVVKVSSISFIKEDLAHVQFQTEDFIDGASAGLPQEWASLVEFRFTNEPVSGTDLLNPFGFEVTSYRRDTVTTR